MLCARFLRSTSTLNLKFIFKTEGVDGFLRKNHITFKRLFRIGQPVRAPRYFFGPSFLFEYSKTETHMFVLILERHQIDHENHVDLKMRPVLPRNRT